ncbi:MAG TPA: acyl-CoA dehydrogenase family protein [Candidatus Hydrogenedentes bacterium]|nr:acyl-CoA dehydrogenase family protein [Candidatus Hydrogenedentota bacterium]
MAEENKDKDVAMQIAEDARQAEWDAVSFTAELFKGDFRWDLINPFPAQDAEDKKIGDEYIEKVKKVLEEHVDPYEIDRTGVYPREALKAMADIGLFGMKIPKEYDGLGLSISNYARVLGVVGSYCSNTVTYLSAHQSIGVPQPLKEFGTPEQKKRFLPRLAKGEISAFALTEPNVGSDPAKMITVAEPSEDGTYYTLNGDKLWTTNGYDDLTTLIVVLARTPDKVLANGKKIPQITAFVVESNMPGFERARRCEFMGLRGIANAALVLRNVKVPVENMIGKPGQGLKIALSTLNVGRLGLPAAGLGTGRAFLEECQWWSTSRVQWGQSVGKHQSVTKMIANYAASLFSMQSMVSLTCALADKQNADIRLEAAAAKYYCSETLWKMLDDYMQVRGGRGYESALSLYNRGDRPSGLEMVFRDMRIGRIFEGSSQVMHLIMAREALDTHFKLVMPIMMPKPGQKEGMVSLIMKAAKFYVKWYPSTWMPPSRSLACKNLNGVNRSHLSYAAKTAKRLARNLFHTMAKFGPKMEYEQIILGNFVDIGTDLFVMGASLAYAEHLLGLNPSDQTPQDLADLFCKEARKRIEANFKAVKCNHNRMYKKVGAELMDGKLNWMASECMNPIPPKYRDYEKNDYDHPASDLEKKD